MKKKFGNSAWDGRKNFLEESKRKRSDAHKGQIPWNKDKKNIYSEETKKKMSESKIGENHPMFGKHKSQETKEKIRMGNLGKKQSEEAKIKISIARTGKHNSLDSEFKKGHFISEETRKKMGLAHKGIKQKQSEESKMKRNKSISETKKRLFKEGKLISPFLGKKHSLESRQKIKEKRAYQLFLGKDTTIEIKIQNFLKELKIEFFTHQYMHIEHGYQCDIFIPSLNMVIEADGDYWHSYPTGKDIDHIRTKELLEKGFKVLRLWEFEINDMTIEEFKDKLI